VSLLKNLAPFLFSTFLLVVPAPYFRAGEHRYRTSLQNSLAELNPKGNAGLLAKQITRDARVAFRSDNAIPRAYITILGFLLLLRNKDSNLAIVIVGVLCLAAMLAIPILYNYLGSAAFAWGKKRNGKPRHTITWVDVITVALTSVGAITAIARS
jgi:hypothetical protein